MINKKEIAIYTILLVINFLFHTNVIFGSMITIIQLLFVIYYLFIKGSIKKGFYWHLMFMLSSLESPLDGNISVTSMFNYKHFELPFLPVSLSTLLTLLIFILAIFSKNKVIIKKSDLAQRFVFVFFAIPLFTGLIGVMVRGYTIENFISSMLIPLSMVLIYQLLLNWSEPKDLKTLESLIISSLIGSVVGSYIGAFLGFQSYYGGNITLPSNQLLLFSPFLLCISLFIDGRDKRTVFIVGILASLEMIVFNISGKGIIFVLIAIVLYLIKRFFNKKKVLSVILFSSILVIVGSFIYGYLMDSSNLFRYKLSQVIGLLNINNWGTGLVNVPRSPRIRLIETLNIFLSLKENFIDLLVGRGYGGYFTDVSNLFNTVDLSMGAFSDSEILTGKYLRPHESLNEILLLSGVIGLYYWFRTLIKLLKMFFMNNINSTYAIIAFMFVILMWNTYVILTYFGIIILFVAIRVNDNHRYSVEKFNKEEI